MMYILDEQEFGQLRRNHKLPDEVTLISVCQHIAETHIATVAVNGLLMPKGRPHGCIHVKHPRSSGLETPRYCDGCQIAGICPQPKNYSK